MEFIKMNMEEFNSRYYINVASIMNKNLPRPTPKRTIYKNGDELLKLIGVVVPLWE